MSGWIKCSDRMPDKDQVVFWYEPGRVWPMWIGAYSKHPESGMVVTHAYNIPYCLGGNWEVTNAKWDDDYQPTHYCPFPGEPLSAHGSRTGRTKAAMDKIVEMVRRL